MTIIRNFATHAITSMTKARALLATRMRGLASNDVQAIHGWLYQELSVEAEYRVNHSVKFIGPLNGQFIDRLHLFGDDGMDMPRLPFESILLEIDLELGAQTDPVFGSARVQPDRACIIAFYPDNKYGLSRSFRDVYGDPADDEFIVTAIFGFADAERPWQPYSGAVLVTSREDVRGRVLFSQPGPKNICLLPLSLNPEMTGPTINAAVIDLGKEALAIAELCNVLACTNVSVETISAPEALNAKRVRNGKLPFFEYHVLKIEERTSSNVERGGTHAPPRLHYRRGHIRRLPDNRKTWVRPAMVGDKSRGLIVKDYDVRTSAGDAA